MGRWLSRAGVWAGGQVGRLGNSQKLDNVMNELSFQNLVAIQWYGQL